MECPRCGSMVQGNDCPYCGYGLITREEEDGKEDAFGEKVRYYLVIFMLLSFISYLIMTVSLMILSTPQGYDYTSVGREVFYIVLLVPVGITWLTGLSLTIYYILLVLAILASTIYLFYRSADFFSDVGLKKENLRTDILNQPLTRLALLFSVMTFLSYAYYILIEVSDVSPTTPPLEQESFGRVVFWMTQAAVWEEVVIRLVFFGVPMMIYAYSKSRPDIWKYLFGGFGLDEKPVIPLILVSSIIFAAAHLPGWDLSKMPPTFLAGIIFGYLFAKDGLYSCIIFHFAWNYMYLYSRLSYDFTLILGVLTLLWMAAGTYFTYHYTKEGIQWFKQKKGNQTRPKEEKEDFSLTFGKNAGFVCSNCRSYKAHYTESGKLKCKTCGRETDLSSNDSLKKIKSIEAKRQWPPTE